MFKVAYANKDKIQNSITQGVIPAESLIVTNNDNKEAELSYYDENGNLKSIVKKTVFESEDEMRLWVAKYDYSGELITYKNKDNNWKSGIIKENSMVSDLPVNEDVILSTDELYLNGGGVPEM